MNSTAGSARINNHRIPRSQKHKSKQKKSRRIKKSNYNNNTMINFSLETYDFILVIKLLNFIYKIKYNENVL